MATTKESGGYKRNRPDHDGKHRLAFERAKRKILATESICGICGQPVDKKLKYPDPMSPCIDHIIPIDRNGHPSDISNLQLAHWKCNRAKANKLIAPVIRADQSAAHTGAPGTPPAPGTGVPTPSSKTNRLLPLSMDWAAYKGEK